MRSIWVVWLCAAACKSSEPPRFEGAMPVRFGDCAPSTVAFVSGPRPLPFAADEAEGRWQLASQDDPPPPPADDKPDDGAGGTGTALALDEGKMGKRDAKSARDQAIERARDAGILNQLGTGGFDDSNISGGLLGDEAGEMNGGFGFGRAGSGTGGGTGWGTIGTGRSGSIGRRRANAPTVSTGQPNAQGDLDKAVVRRYIRRNIQRIQYCYEKQLLAKPNLAGTVSTEFLIKPDGTVTSATASGVDPEVASCVAAVIESIEFPKPKGGGLVRVRYPFTFHPAGGDSAIPSAATGSADAPAPPPPPPPPPAPAKPRPQVDGAPAPAPAPLTGRDLYRPRTARPVDDAPYRVGRDNPLRDHASALEECFRKNPQHAGVAVVELGYDASGAVTNATAHGIDDERTRACVVEVATKVRRGANAATERCGMSFGELPVAELPGIDISADAIALAGKSVASAKDAQGDTIPALVTAIAARRDAATSSTAPVALYGPLVLRAEPTASMKAVTRAMTSVVVAGDDFVLATRDGSAWKLVSHMALPVEPVPVGTGGRWLRMKTATRGRGGDDERLVLSLLVAHDSVWVGISRVLEFTQVKRDQLLVALKEHKHSAFFGDSRTDIEIAGADDATYADVIAAIDIAAQAGFPDWIVATPSSLAARLSL